MQTIAPFHKKTLSYSFGESELEFKVAQELFSSHQVDTGSKRLLRTMLFANLDYSKVLDLGCGYGPLGLTLKKHRPKTEVRLIDRDALALEFTRENASHNQLEVETSGSLGYDQVLDHDFDLIISNIPAKVSPQVLEHLLYDAYFFLQKKKGTVAIVVIDAIAGQVTELLSADEIEITYHKNWPGHHVFHYQFKSHPKNSSQPATFEDGLYHRGQVDDLTTTYHLAEFDRPHFSTQLILDYLSQKKLRRVTHALNFHPGQGHLAKKVQAKNLSLAGSDLQALKTTQLNLNDKEVKTYHTVLLNQVENQEFDLVIGIIPEKQNREANQVLFSQINQILADNGTALIAGTSTAITRLDKYNKQQKLLKREQREKKHGHSLLVLGK